MGIKMRHDAHYVEELARTHRTIGRIVSIEKISPNPEQPRVEFGDLSELTDSIRQNGVLEPLLLKPKDDGTWMIIAGERRWRAATLAGLTEVPCVEFDIDEQSIAEIALIENLQRKDLTVWEEADGLAYLSDKFKYTHEEIAKKIGKSRTTVTEFMTLANLPSTIRDKCFKFEISAKSTLLEIARQFDEQAMHDFLTNIQSQNLNRDEVRRTARAKNKIIPKDKDLEITEIKESGQSPKNIQENPSGDKKSFQYFSPENNFNLTINFHMSDRFTKKDVLRALKEVFDNTK